jgi:hypothetical protein
VVENDAEELVQLVDFEEEWCCEEETNIVENDAQKVLLVVDFEEEG